MPYSREFTSSIFKLGNELSECAPKGRIAALESWFKDNEVLIHQGTELDLGKLKIALETHSPSKHTIALTADEITLLETCLCDAKRKEKEGRLGEVTVEDISRVFKNFAISEEPKREENPQNTQNVSSGLEDFSFSLRSNKRRETEEGEMREYPQNYAASSAPSTAPDEERKTIRIRRRMSSGQIENNASGNDSLERTNSAATIVASEKQQESERSESRRSRSAPPASPAQQVRKRVAAQLQQTASRDLTTTTHPR